MFGLGVGVFRMVVEARDDYSVRIAYRVMLIGMHVRTHTHERTHTHANTDAHARTHTHTHTHAPCPNAYSTRPCP